MPRTQPLSVFRPFSTLRFTALAVCVSLTACGKDAESTEADESADLAIVASSAALSTETADDVRTGLDVDALLAGFGGRPRIKDTITALVAERSPCAEVTHGEGQVTIDLGDGCVLPGSGKTVSGQLNIAVENEETQRSLDVELVSFGADIKATGTVHLEAEAGARSREISVQLSDGRALDWTGGATWAEGRVAFAGEATAVSADDKSTRIVYADFSWVRGDCYPSSGTATVTPEESATVVVTFSAETPETGEVTVKVGRAPAVSYSLPMERCTR